MYNQIVETMQSERKYERKQNFSPFRLRKHVITDIEEILEL